MDLTSKQFKELLEIATKESPFLFNDKLYVQTDGVALGSCLGPSFANKKRGPSKNPKRHRQFVRKVYH